MPIDYKKYPPNWKTEIVPTVIQRAKNKCEWCHLQNGQTVYAIKLYIKDLSGKYKQKSVWFSQLGDAGREAGISPETHSPEEAMRLVKPVKVVLTIAHLDHDELNHNVKIDRLRALCQMCHLRYDAKEKYRRSLL